MDAGPDCGTCCCSGFASPCRVLCLRSRITANQDDVAAVKNRLVTIQEEQSSQQEDVVILKRKTEHLRDIEIDPHLVDKLNKLKGRLSTAQGCGLTRKNSDLPSGVLPRKGAEYVPCRRSAGPTQRLSRQECPQAF